MASLVLSLGGACSSGGSSGPPPPASSCNATPIMVTEPRSVDSLYGDQGAACGWGTGGVTFGMHAAGASCGSPDDCTPTCCPCPNAAYHSIATWRNEGSCATPEQTCCMILGSNDCGNGG
jgi:hypothetical protein